MGFKAIFCVMTIRLAHAVSGANAILLPRGCGSCGRLTSVLIAYLIPIFVALAKAFRTIGCHGPLKVKLFG